MPNGNIVNTYKKLTSYSSWRDRARSQLRNSAVFLLSRLSHINRTSGWIRFPYYHHVFDDERQGFSRQLKYLRSYGEFISLDEAVNVLNSGSRIDGRYFCITFDDGIKSCYDNAMPILAEMQIAAAFFIVTSYTADADRGENRTCKPLYLSLPYSFEYLTWQECKQMIRAGMIIGSHTVTHVKLSDLSENQVSQELESSKQAIEQRLGCRCNHFACPWGRIGLDFSLGRDEHIAKNIGYMSFLTTRRGPMYPGDTVYLIRRDHTLANWGNYQLRYFLSL